MVWSPPLWRLELYIPSNGDGNLVEGPREPSDRGSAAVSSIPTQKIMSLGALHNQEKELLTDLQVQTFRTIELCFTELLTLLQYHKHREVLDALVYARRHFPHVDSPWKK